MTAGCGVLNYRVPRLADPTALPIPRPRREANPYTPAYALPEQEVRAAPELVQQLRELRVLTGWTNRTLADIIGVSHPTVGEALRGQANALSRSPAQRRRLADAYAVVSRIYLLAGRDAERMAAALDTPDASDHTAIDLLTAGQTARAYLAAARALRPTRIGTMMLGDHPLDPRAARVAVLDED